ncbi:hypothetical protein KY289_037414 [Solanum tuberosum]|nr:hypothetical protein KY289_037414 [Solanum tuberosum]
MKQAKQVGVTEEERKDNLEGNLRSLLKRKRYVILLDDILGVEIWNYLKLVLPEYDSKIGSRIIITSRNSDVGRYIGGDSSLCVLQPLDSENSFELFSKKIFNFENNNNWANASPDLVNIGRSIVGRCGGVPLAIVVTAGMLRARERTEHTWSRVLESMGHKVQDGCAKVLALSYNDLPIALRPSFLYFGLFPEDHEIHAFDLTNMWITEKLIVVNSGNGREAESLAEDILIVLVSRNLIQVAKRKYNGRISSCRIHDLLHSLCVELGKESNFFHTEHNAFGDPENVARVVRRITFYSDNNAMIEFLRSNPKPTKLRALFCFINDRCLFSDMAHLNFKLLQVFVVVISADYSCGVTLSPVPTALEVLKLSVSRHMSEQINLSSYPNIVKLHLDVFGTMRLNSEAFPPNLVKLTLVRYKVDGHVVAVLKKLPKLRILKMVWCKHNEEKMDLAGDGDSFPQLEVLHIYEPDELSEVTCMDDASMPKLKKLLLVQCRRSPISLSERLAKLRI